MYGVIFTDANRHEAVPIEQAQRRTQPLRKEHAEAVAEKKNAEHCDRCRRCAECRANSIEIDFGTERGAA